MTPRSGALPSQPSHWRVRVAYDVVEVAYTSHQPGRPSNCECPHPLASYTPREAWNMCAHTVATCPPHPLTRFSRPGRARKIDDYQSWPSTPPLDKLGLCSQHPGEYAATTLEAAADVLRAERRPY
ncbi:uncharacterized protein TRAVEDRAFT_32539, partial [Trametes versicolor FP-101664 SS1]